MHQDLHGKQQNKGTMLIEIRQIGVRFDGRDLLADNGPHEVPGWFGYELVSSSRAREVSRPAPAVPAPAATEVTHVDPVVTHSDPVVTNRDPVATNAVPAAASSKPPRRGNRK